MNKDMSFGNGLKKSDLAEAIGELENETFVIGEAVFIRTITHHITGRIVRISQLGRLHFLHLEDAAWIADDGRFMGAIEKGELNEVEPVTSEVRVNTASIIDVYAWNHPLPKTQK